LRGWSESGVEVRVVALAHPVESHIEVGEQVVRIEVRLPGLLGVFGGLIAGLYSNSRFRK
jgi:hypothetical protein